MSLLNSIVITKTFFVCFLLGNSPGVWILYANVRYTYLQVVIPTCLWTWNRVFRNVGIYNLNAGELPRRKHTAFGAGRNLKSKIFLNLWATCRFLIKFTSPEGATPPPPRKNRAVFVLTQVNVTGIVTWGKTWRKTPLMCDLLTRNNVLSISRSSQNFTLCFSTITL